MAAMTVMVDMNQVEEAMSEEALLLLKNLVGTSLICYYLGIYQIICWHRPFICWPLRSVGGRLAFTTTISSRPLGISMARRYPALRFCRQLWRGNRRQGRDTR